MESLGTETGTAGLNGFNLSLAPGKAVETGGQLEAVEELALLGLNGAQRRARVTADGTLGERGATERAVLLSLGAVGSERVGQNARGRGGVRTRSVVNGL